MVILNDKYYNEATEKRKGADLMLYKTVQIQIPEAMEPYINNENELDIRKRNALLLYPYILDRKISHGKAAEILGICKMDLIDLYGQMGFCYFDQIQDELEKDLQTFSELGLSGVAK